MAIAETVTDPVRGARLVYRRQGSGPAFVWGHGLQSSMAQEDAAGLFDWSSLTTDVELVRYDARGHGSSAAVGDGSAYTWPALALDLLGLLDALDLDRVVAGGASMGAATSLWAATLAPERFLALVLVIPPTAWETRRAQQRLYSVLGAASRSGLLGLGAPLLTRLPLPAVRPGTRGALARAGFEEVLRDGAHRLALPFAGAARSDLPAPDALRTLRLPVLVLAWSGDRSHPLSTAERLAALLPDAELRIARRDVDLVTWPDEIRRFLRRLDRPPA